MMRRAAEACLKLGLGRTVVDVWKEQPAQLLKEQPAQLLKATAKATAKATDKATDYFLSEEERVIGRLVKSKEKGMFRLEICSADDATTPRYTSPELQGCGNRDAIAAEDCGKYALLAEFYVYYPSGHYEYTGIGTTKTDAISKSDAITESDAISNGDAITTTNSDEISKSNEINKDEEEDECECEDVRVGKKMTRKLEAVMREKCVSYVEGGISSCQRPMFLELGFKDHPRRWLWMCKQLPPAQI